MKAPARPRSRATPRAATPADRTVRVALGVALALFVLHAALLRQFIIDDAYISYRVARNLAAGLGPVFNPGEHVEAFSNPLFTYLLAPLAWLAPGTEILPSLARGVGLLAGVGTLIVLAGLPLAGGTPATTLALLLCAASTSMTLWSIGGLETSLYGLLILAGVAIALRRPRTGAAQVGFGLILAAIALSRPEGLLPAAAILLWRLLDTETRRDAGGHARVLVAAVLPLAGYLAFRHAWYGEWLPNTYYAKRVSLDLAWPRGLAYLREFVARNGTALFYLPGLLVLGALRRHRAAALALLVVIFYLPYVVIVGGDWMDAHRFLAPVVPLISVIVAEGWVAMLSLARAAFERRGAPAAARVALPTGVLIAVGILAAANVPNTRRVREAPYVSSKPYYETMGRVVAEVSQPEWTVATDDIGAIGWFGRIRVLDMLGLANPDMARGRTAPQYLVAGRMPGLLVMHYDDSALPRARWRTLKIRAFDSLYVRPRGPVPLPGSLRASIRVLPYVEARLQTLPASLDSELVRLDAYLREHQPDMRPVVTRAEP